jgi:uncharacterized protein YndB with AHSA1/START domain
MERLMSRIEPIVVEQTFSAPIDRVWRSITDKDQMRQWFFDSIEEFKAERGFEARFNVRNEDRDYLHLWKVTEVIPQRRLAYDWKYGGIPGESFVVWDLTETGTGTRLNLTHTVVETFPQDDPAFTRESGEAGWRYFLCDRLKAFLERAQP